MKNSVEAYIATLPEDRKDVINQLRKIILDHLPEGFSETFSYGSIAYAVPHSIYPDGYHCDPKEPLPFINVASQKNFIALYHMGIYAYPALHDWFINEYPKHCKTKLDMGKSCIRFKKPENIPFELIGELCSKISSKEWIEIYESKLKK